MKTFLLLLIVCALPGCAGLPEPRGHELAEYKEIDRRNLYVDTATACRRTGGYMIVKTTGRLPRSGVPRQGDAYACKPPSAL